jgi:hypothetical protein
MELEHFVSPAAAAFRRHHLPIFDMTMRGVQRLQRFRECGSVS